MIPYLYILFLLTVFLSLIPLKIKTEKLVFWSFLIPMILVAGFRTIGVDQDSLTYVDIYNSENIKEIVEPTFVLISQIVRYFFDNNIQYLFLIYAILGIGLKFFAINRYTDLLILTLVIYIARAFPYYELNVIRASVSCSLLLLSIKPLADRKIWNFLFYVILATLFHYSSILILALWFFSNSGMSQKKRIAFGLVIPAIYILYILKIDIIKIGLQIIEHIPVPLIQQKIHIYLGTRNISVINPFNLIQISHILFFYYLLYFYDSIQCRYKYFTILLKIYALSIVSLPLLSGSFVMAWRISELFGISEILLLPFAYHTLKPGIAGKMVIIGIGVFYFWYNVYFIRTVYW
jgi:hypothetical protein